MIKILFCSNTFTHIHHGPAKFANLILGMNHNNDDLEIKVLTEDIEVSTESVIKAKMVWVKRFPGVKMLCKILDYYQNIKRIRSEYSVDILVFNHALVGLLAAIRFKDIPVVGMINDDNSSSLSIFTLKFDSTWFRYFVFKQFEFAATKFLDHIIVNSNFLLEDLVKSYDVKRTDISRLYKGISLDNINLDLPYRPIDRKSPICILFVKSDFVRGGLFNLIKALGILDNLDFKLIVIGPTSSSEVRIKDAICRNTELVFMGRQTQSVVYELLSYEADIFCVPSVKEGLGVANMEALAHKVTVVGTNVGGIPEVLDDGKGGWLCEPKPTSIAQAIKDAIEHENENLEKRRHGFNYCKESFNESKLLDTFSVILNKVLTK